MLQVRRFDSITISTQQNVPFMECCLKMQKHAVYVSKQKMKEERKSAEATASHLVFEKSWRVHERFLSSIA
jgi:hypothetical protein